MKRDIDALRGQVFDLLIVGGGAFGACAAWDAVQRGYSVALVEANDFGSGTSANSYKFVHGGIRYLQHFDFRRLWESCRERSALLRIAPHLVSPMPIVLPTYGIGRAGKGFLGAGMLAYDMLTPHRNLGIPDSDHHIPMTSFMSRSDVQKRFPGIRTDGLTGGAVFADAQMYHPPRLVFEFIQSAARRGAQVANYVRANAFLRKGDRIHGVQATDRISGNRFEVCAKVVLNAAGPWSEDVLATDDIRLRDPGVYSRDTYFVVDEAPQTDCALAIQGRSEDQGAVINRGARHLFVVPWRGRGLIGVWHGVYRRSAAGITVDATEINRFLTEFNQSTKTLRIDRRDIRMVNAGLVPFGDSDNEGQKLTFGKVSTLVDSEREHGLSGLVTLIGVRHTMARGDASRALNMVDAKLGRRGAVPDTTTEVLDAGRIEDFEQLFSQVSDTLAPFESAHMAKELIALHGAGVGSLFQSKRSEADLGVIGGAELIGAQIDHAVRQEMAVTLGDVVFRRTAAAAAGSPGRTALAQCAERMSTLLDWSEARKEREVSSVLDRFPCASSAGRIDEPAVEELRG